MPPDAGGGGGGRLANRRILITGAASGIGLATARLFLAEGAAVAALDNRPQALDAALTALREVGADAATIPVYADVTDMASVAAGTAAAAAALGGLDGVVNAAGVDLLQPFEEMTAGDWHGVLAINLTGPMQVCQAVLPLMKAAGGGSIVNIASGAALRPLAERTAYCASKAGLVMLTKTLALELAPHGVRANAICPGAIDTPMLELSYRDRPDPEAALQAIRERYALGRIGEVDDIAEAALYLTSDAAGFVTGAALAVDGGRAFH